VEKLATYVVREGALSASDAVGWIVRACATLEHIHVLGVAHGRVSAKAIQIASPHCDDQGYFLDASDLVDDPAYFSPERAAGQGRSPEDDAWAMGVTLYRMLTGQLPFPGTDASVVLERIRKHPPSPLAVYDVGDDEIQQLLDQLFTVDRGARLTSLADLRRGLTRWNTTLEQLPALRFGRPGADDDEDVGEDDAMTAVFQLRTPSAKPPRPEVARAAPRTIPDAALADAKPAPKGPPDSDDDLFDEPTAVLATHLELASPSRALERRPRRPVGPRDDVTDDIAPPSPRILPVAAPPPPHAPASPAVPGAPGLPKDMAPGTEPASPPKSASSAYLLGAMSVVVLAVATYFFFPRGASDVAPPAASTRAAATTPTTATPTVAASTTEQPPASSASTHNTAAAVTAAPPRDLAACVASMFAPETFTERELDFGFLCEETNPIKGANRLHTQVVLGGGGEKGVTDGMREWANLGWYAMGAFALVRGHCCEAPAALRTPTALAVCELDTRLTALGEAASGSDADAAAAALDQLNEAVYCLARGGTAHVFGQEGMPRGGEFETFRKAFTRARPKGDTP
jgi:hypothetical protein